MDQFTKQIIFFILFFAILLPVIYGSNVCVKNTSTSPLIVSSTSALGLICIIIFFFFIFGLGNSSSVIIDNYKYQVPKQPDDRLLNINPAALCAGGWYMHQGDDPKSKMCQKMMNSPEGRKVLEKSCCPFGQVGQEPFRDVKYTPLSGLQWQDERAESCPPKDWPTPYNSC